MWDEPFFRHPSCGSKASQLCRLYRLILSGDGNGTARYGSLCGPPKKLPVLHANSWEDAAARKVALMIVVNAEKEVISALHCVGVVQAAQTMVMTYRFALWYYLNELNSNFLAGQVSWTILLLFTNEIHIVEINYFLSSILMFPYTCWYQRIICICFSADIWKHRYFYINWYSRVWLPLGHEMTVLWKLPSFSVI